ncbi:MAG TPA: helix-turn-helix domain-containing protein [Candidatus Olsenella avicola]|nr:helix-turn-helix domain-containing protein [Candidatus Olsenella avicola]
MSAACLSTPNAMCRALDCQPGDILEHVPDEGDGPEGTS